MKFKIIKRIQPKFFIFILVWFAVLFTGVYFLVSRFEARLVFEDRLEHARQFADLAQSLTTKSTSLEKIQQVLIKLNKSDKDLKRIKLKIKSTNGYRSVLAVAGSKPAAINFDNDMKAVKNGRPVFEQEKGQLEILYPLTLGGRQALLSFKFHRDDEQALLSNFKIKTIAMLLFILASLLLIIYLLTKHVIIKSLNKLQQMADNVNGSMGEINTDAFADDEIGSLAQSLKEMSNKEKSYIKKVKFQLEELDVLYNISKLGQLNVDEDQLLSLSLRNLVKIVGAEAGAILLCEESRESELDIHELSSDQHGLDSSSQKPIDFINKAVYDLNADYIDAGINDNFIRAAKQAVLTASQQQSEISLITKGTSNISRYQLYALPIVLIGDSPIGVVVIVSEASISDAKMKFLVTAISDLAANYHRLHLISDLQASYLTTIKTLNTALEKKDASTAGHSERVAKLAIQTAVKLNLSQKEINIIKEAAFLHDIGKIGINYDIINKNNRLNEAEYEQMKLHCLYGTQIISKAAFLKAAKPIIFHHHERFDGRGYPKGLKGEGIPIGARILAVCDAYDAMASTRPYRRAIPYAQVMDTLKAESGRQFDPKVIEAFLTVFDEQHNQQLTSKVIRLTTAL